MSILKKTGIRLLCVALVLVSLVALTACQPGDISEWKMSDDELSAAVELNLTLQEDGQNKTIRVTYPEEIFRKNIAAKEIGVIKYTMTYGDESEEAQNSSATQEDVSIERVSGSELVLKFTDDVQGVWMYEIGIHKNAITKKVFAYGSVFPTVVEVLDEEVSAEIEGEYTKYAENPVISVKLNGTTVRAGLTADKIGLGGAFEGLSVTAISAEGNAVRLSTSGVVAAGTALTGFVTLPAEATLAGIELTAVTEVVYRALSVDKTSFAYADGFLTFDVVSMQAKWQGTPEDAAGKIAWDKSDVRLLAFSDDGSRATFAVAGATADAAAQAVSGSKATFDATLFDAGVAQEFSVELPRASLVAAIDYVSIADGKGNATAYVFAKNGSFGPLQAVDLTFGGDFAGASVDEMKRLSDDSYIVKFAFDVEGTEVPDPIALQGSVAISENQLFNIWGTESDLTETAVSYYADDNKGETWDAIKGFVDANQGVFSTIGTVGSAIGGVASAANGINTILQLVGVIETTDDKLDKINNSLASIAGSIAQIDSKLNNMATLIIQNGVDAAERSYVSQRNQAAMIWEQYLTKVTALNGYINKYNVNYYRELVSFINAASAYEVIVYKNEKGEITLPGRIDGFDVEGIRIASAVPMQIGIELDAVKAKVAQRGGAYDGIWNDIAVEIKQKYAGEGAEAETYIQALKLAIARKAFGVDLAADIVNAFRDMSYALAGSALGSPVSVATVTPLDQYYIMLGCYYNFASEAHADMEAMLGWLSGYLVKGASLATFAMTCEDGVTVEDKEEINRAYATALKEISDQADQLQKKAGKIWSLIAGNTLKTSELEIKLWRTESRERQLLWTYYKAALFVRYDFGNALNQVNLEVMRNRWSRLYQAGIVSAKTFVDYLIGVGLITKEMENAYVMVEQAYNSDLPTDNSISLKVNDIYKSSWFTMGQSYSIGSSGKYSADNFDYRGQLLGKAYKLSDGSTVTRLGATARYYEFHWYWFDNNEWVYFWYSIGDAQPFIVFEIGK